MAREGTKRGSWESLWTWSRNDPVLESRRRPLLAPLPPLLSLLASAALTFWPEVAAASAEQAALDAS